MTVIDFIIWLGQRPDALMALIILSATIFYVLLRSWMTRDLRARKRKNDE